MLASRLDLLSSLSLDSYPLRILERTKLVQSSWAVHTGRLGLNECPLSSMLLTVDMYDMSGQSKFSFWDRVHEGAGGT